MINSFFVINVYDVLYVLFLWEASDKLSKPNFHLMNSKVFILLFVCVILIWYKHLLEEVFMTQWRDSEWVLGLLNNKLWLSTWTALVEKL